MTNLDFSRLTLSTIALASSLTVISTASGLASTVTYNLTGTVDFGSLLGETYFGSFSFDRSALTGMGLEDLPVSTINFSFLGSTYTETEANTPPKVEFEDGSFLGLSFAVDTFDPSFTLIPGFFDVSEAYFAYSPISGEAGFGDVQYSRVPEPTSAISFLALGALVVVFSRMRIRG